MADSWNGTRGLILGGSGMWRVKSGVFAKRSVKLGMDSIGSFGTSRMTVKVPSHPGGSTATDRIHVGGNARNGFYQGLCPSRMTVNRILKKKRGPGGGCKEGGPWPSQLGKVPLPCPSPGRRPLRRQAGRIHKARDGFYRGFASPE